MITKLKKERIFFPFLTVLMLIFFASCGGKDVIGDSESSLDSDGDGIANDLEVNGYTYGYISGTYSPWDGDISRKYFKSDPRYASTDGDPYSDSMEASGLKMDRSVRSPGNHPMVPAYPNFVVKLINYSVTLNSTITETNGTEHQKNTNWNTDTYDITATTDEIHWDVSHEVSFSLKSIGASSSLSAGASHSETKTTGTVRSYGGGIMDSNQWSLATCSNPSEAAKIKLTLLAKNVGTCTANNVRLTMNLKIGGQIVATEETPIPIYSLDKDNSFEWVVSDIMLTYRELRALETGSPVSVEITQVTADVVKEVDGKMVSIGKWENYMGRARAVCANIFLDLGDGNTINQLVYADNSETSPKVTLKDALIWAANGQEDPLLGPVISFYTPDGLLEKKSLEGWYFSLDATTYDSISAYIQDSGFNLFDTVLEPNSIVVAKAPPIGAWPRIPWATLSTCKEKVTAYVDDYFFSQSRLEVFFVDNKNVEHPMMWNEDERYFWCDCPYNYSENGNEKIIARTPLYKPDKPGEWQTKIEAFDIGFAHCKFKDMGDGTVRDNRTGLIWMKDVSWIDHPASFNLAEWATKMISQGFNKEDYELSDGSSAGDWRLPTKEEWEALVSTDWQSPALVDTLGERHWSKGNPFIIGESVKYKNLISLHWSSTPDPSDPCKIYAARLWDGKIVSVLPQLYKEKSCAGRKGEGYYNAYFWPVRDGD